jgi:flagellar biosynthetic protein FliR
MLLQLDLHWTAATLLLWVRMVMVLTLGPLAQLTRAPTTFWVLFTLVMAGMLSVALGLRATPARSLAGFALQILGEAALGALLGLALHAAFAALGMAGRLLDVQMGFSMGAVLDPVTRANAPVVGVVLTLLGMSVFFGSDGHHALLRGLVFSVQVVPPGGVWQLPDAASLIRPVGAIFGMAVVLMAPALFVLLMVELVLGVASRVLPQMNVLFIGMPVKTLVGLSTLAIAAPAMAPALVQLQAGVLRFWEQVLS